MEYSFTCEKPCEWIITINKITSNNEVNNTFRIATQPGKLILSTQRPQAVQVYDMNGTLKYYNRNLQGEEQLDLTTGIYLIKTNQGSQKVIIQ